MEILDRYLHAIKFWLPRRQKEDIIAELSEDVRSQIEDQEAKLGRQLNQDEVAGILRKRGHPLFVANRYLPQQYLIGPTLFPVYRFVLIIVGLCYLAPRLMVWTGLMIFNPVYRSAHTVWGSLTHGWPSFWDATFFAFGAVTITFAVLERSGFLENWDPRRLPAVQDPNRIPRFNSIIELATNLIFIFWISGMWSQTVLEGAGIRLVLAPAWRGFFWAFLLLAIGNIALAAVNLAHRHWTPLRAILRLALDSAGSVAFCWILKANLLAEIIAPKLTPAQAVEMTHAINASVTKLFPYAVAACVLIVALSDLGRLIRMRTRRAALVQSATMLGALISFVLGAGFPV